MQLREIARQHHADLVGEDLLALVVDDAAAVAVAVEAEADIGAGLAHLVGDGVQHLHVFGIGIVAREGVVEFGVEGDDLAADHFEHLRREGARGAVAASGDDLEPALELRPVGEIGDIAVGEVFDELVGAALPQRESGVEHDVASGVPSPRDRKSSGGSAPIFTPVQPLSLCEAVTIATQGQSSANWPK